MTTGIRRSYKNSINSSSIDLRSKKKNFDIKDPDKRKDVDEWLEWAGSGKGDWRTAIHLNLRWD